MPPVSGRRFISPAKRGVQVSFPYLGNVTKAQTATSEGEARSPESMLGDMVIPVGKNSARIRSA